MPALGARLAWFEFPCWCFCPHSTNVRDFVAAQLHEQCRCGIENFPVESRFLRDVLTGFVDRAFGAAGHVLDGQFFHCHQRVFAGQWASFFVQCRKSNRFLA